MWCMQRKFRQDIYICTLSAQICSSLRIVTVGRIAWSWCATSCLPRERKEFKPRVRRWTCNTDGFDERNSNIMFLECTVNQISYVLHVNGVICRGSQLGCSTLFGVDQWMRHWSARSRTVFEGSPESLMVTPGLASLFQPFGTNAEHSDETGTKVPIIPERQKEKWKPKVM